MSEISSGTIKEICDTVYKNVLDEIKENLSQMKPQIVQEIVEVVTEREKNAYKDLNRKYAERINTLESAPARIEKKVRKLETLEKRVQKFEMSSFNSKTLSSSSGKVSLLTSKTSKIDVSRLKYRGFTHNGWIYYPNENMGEFLYKVKVDGTCNTQLTDYSVFGELMRISGGYLHFRDSEYKERSIKID